MTLIEYGKNCHIVTKSTEFGWNVFVFKLYTPVWQEFRFKTEKKAIEAAKRAIDNFAENKDEG